MTPTRARATTLINNNNNNNNNNNKESTSSSYDDHQHRIFPAAQTETYTTNNNNHDPAILGIVSSHNISFTLASTSNNSNNNNNNNNTVTTKVAVFVQAAFHRFQQSLTNFPDFQDEYLINPLHLPLQPLSPIQIVVESSNVTLSQNVSEDYTIRIQSEREQSQQRDTTDDESDTTNGTDDDAVVLVSLHATTVFGILRALETLAQLLEFGWMDPNAGNEKNEKKNEKIGIYCLRDLPLFISDRPSFPYRGLMIDTARHYLPLPLILDNLRVMELNKMNVLHWHISDAQSFPYATPSFPELATKGAFHPHLIYTPEQVHTVVQEAYWRGIRVIPEIDMPGHTAAIFKSHPEVMSQCPHPFGYLINPTISDTYHFLDTLYGDLNEVFVDEYVHVGGDEVQGSEPCWLQDPLIAQWMQQHNMHNNTGKLYDYFETRLLNDIVVSKYHKIPIVWQEVFNRNLTIPSDTIIDVWKGFDTATIQNATQQNHPVLLSGCWYLDHLDQTWEHFYAYHPRNFTGTDRQHHLLWGGHASMWGEHVDASNFMSRVWPRASAVAERLWSGGVTGGVVGTGTGIGTGTGTGTSTIHHHNQKKNDPANTIADRIHTFRCRMVVQGFAAGPTGPGSCPTEVQYHSNQNDQHNYPSSTVVVVDDDSVVDISQLQQ